MGFDVAAPLCVGFPRSSSREYRVCCMHACAAFDDGEFFGRDLRTELKAIFSVHTNARAEMMLLLPEIRICICADSRKIAFYLHAESPGI